MAPFHRLDCNLMCECYKIRTQKKKKMCDFVVFFSQLPVELQERVRKHLTTEEQQQAQKAEEDQRLVRVPIPTFPPTAMVFSVDPRHGAGAGAAGPNSSGGSDPARETVPMSVIAKVLTQGPARVHHARSYLCVHCLRDTVVADKSTQANLLMDHSLLLDRSAGGPQASNGVLPHSAKGMSATIVRTNSSDTVS